MHNVISLLQEPSIILNLQQLFPVDFEDRCGVEGK